MYLPARVCSNLASSSAVYACLSALVPGLAASQSLVIPPLCGIHSSAGLRATQMTSPALQCVLGTVREGWIQELQSSVHV